MNKTDEPKEELVNELDTEVQNSSEKEMYTTGQTVLTRYYKGKSWKYYVGEIESVNIVAKCYAISYFKMIGKKKGDIKFIKTKRITDKDDVPEDSVVKAIDMLESPCSLCSLTIASIISRIHQVQSSYIY